jgi:hypothetical protein
LNKLVKHFFPNWIIATYKKQKKSMKNPGGGGVGPQKLPSKTTQGMKSEN